MDIVIGTAGHIDHGKTTLVRALTGTDTDRLPEEKSRGITVDLGFAEMSAGDMHFSFVDVPGHERFVKNMLAGASGVDMAMLVVAVDEGVMPQTREHFEICRLLGIRNGVIALTKHDLVDADMEKLARMEISELVQGSFLQDAPVIAVSSRTGSGMTSLIDTLVQAAAGLERIEDHSVTRLPIDRSFSVKGFGAVVTGTLSSGSIAEGQEVELLPSGKRLRVRGLQTHGHTVLRADPGQRIAVNLGGADHSQIERGMTLSEPGTLLPTQIIDAEIEVLANAPRSIRTRQRVRVHIGTVEALARVQVLNDRGEIEAGRSGFAQIRLEVPVVAVPGERFIIRSYSPMATIGGGIVIDPHAGKHRRKDLAEVLQDLVDLRAAGNDHARIVSILLGRAGTSGYTVPDLQHRTGLKMEKLKKAVEAAIASGNIAQAGNVFVEQRRLNELSSELVDTLAEFHKKEPLAKGMSRELIRDAVFIHTPDDVFQAVMNKLSSEGVITFDRDVVRSSSHRAELSHADTNLRNGILNSFREARLEVPRIDEILAAVSSTTANSPQQAKKILQLLLDSGEIIKVTEEFYFSSSAINDLIEDIRRHADNSGDRLIDVRKFKEIAGVSRKYAIPLLEYLDRQHITARTGDNRVVL